MAINLLQVKQFSKLFRVALLLASGLLLTACISSQPFPTGVLVVPPAPAPVIRPPQIGQEWVYNVRNVFNQEILDVVTERVVAIGDQVRIQRFGLKAGPLPDEIQGPWGYVIQDPHWSPPQKLATPLPLWPEQLMVGWNQFYRSAYQVLGYPDGNYYWGLGMNAAQWELMKVPAGEFLTLQYHNQIPFFESNDYFRISNIRQEDVWLAPQIGRWVIRRGFGRYLTRGVFWINPYWEDYLQWELISWK